MKKNTLILTVLVLFMTRMTFSQCSNNGVKIAGSLTPLGVGQSTALTYNSGQYVLAFCQAGASYTVSTCNSPSYFDTQLTLYSDKTGEYMGYSDDACGYLSSITFTSSICQFVRIGLNDYYCRNNGYPALVTMTQNSVGSSTLNTTSIANVSCKNDADGSVVVAMTNGIEPITYAISPIVGTQNGGTFSNLSAQTYNFTATDAVGCMANASTTIDKIPMPVVDAGINQTICQGSDARLTANCKLFNINATLRGVSEVPPNTSSAIGNVTGTFNTVTNQLTLKISFSGLSINANAGHIHNASVGVNGPVIVPFTNVPNATAGIFNYSGTLSTVNAAALIAGNTYINIHNIFYPGGEIRGQLALSDCVADDYVWKPGNVIARSTFVSPTVNTTYTVTATNTVTGCSSTASVTVNVNTPSVGGTLSASKSAICNGDAVQLSLGGSSGNITQWEKQAKCTGAWTPIVNTTTDYLVSPTEQTCFRVKTENGVCPSTYSNIASIVVDQPAIAGKLTLAANTSILQSSICPNTNTNLNLKVADFTGKILYWQSNQISSPIWRNIPNTNGQATYTAIGSAISITTFYRAIICSELGLCTGTKALAYSNLFRISLKTNCAPPPPAPSLASHEGVPNIMTLVKAYPIPSNSQITFEIDGSTEGVTQIEIMDLTGKIIQRSSQNMLDGFNELTIDIQNLVKGLYLVKVKDSSNQEAVLKVSKM
jgi:CHRD domain/Secretion system C-terminal sorting domain